MKEDRERFEFSCFKEEIEVEKKEKKINKHYSTLGRKGKRKMREKRRRKRNLILKEERRSFGLVFLDWGNVMKKMRALFLIYTSKLILTTKKNIPFFIGQSGSNKKMECIDDLCPKVNKYSFEDPILKILEFELGFWPPKAAFI